MPPPLKSNRVLQSLAEGRICTGCWLFMGSPVVTEVLADMPLEALIIDLEHSPSGLETAIEQLRAAAPFAPTMLARVPGFDSDRIKPLLDAGVEGILAPNVESAEQVERLVDACRYPPLGRRGLHYTVSRAAAWGAHAGTYAAHADRNTLVAAMIESARGVEAIPAMAAVHGLDLFFIGPLDLSASIGRPGEYDSPEFIELWTEAERRCRESKIALGGTLLPGHGLATLAARGYGFVTVGSDVTLLRHGALQQLGGAGA